MERRSGIVGQMIIPPGMQAGPDRFSDRVFVTDLPGTLRGKRVINECPCATSLSVSSL